MGSAGGGFEAWDPNPSVSVLTTATVYVPNASTAAPHHYPHHPYPNPPPPGYPPHAYQVPTSLWRPAHLVSGWHDVGGGE